MTRPVPPTIKQIKAAWCFWLVEIGKFDSLTEIWEPQQKDWLEDSPELKGRDYCWGCGMAEEVERAHIIAHMEGGSNEVENYGLLCRYCHIASEMIDGLEYMNWLETRNASHVWFELIAYVKGGMTSVLAGYKEKP